jgi:hypothetical protein
MHCPVHFGIRGKGVVVSFVCIRDTEAAATGGEREDERGHLRSLEAAARTRKPVRYRVPATRRRTTIRSNNNKDRSVCSTVDFSRATRCG